jgi:hypothetical protein
MWDICTINFAYMCPSMSNIFCPHSICVIEWGPFQVLDSLNIDWVSQTKLTERKSRYLAYPIYFLFVLLCQKNAGYTSLVYFRDTLSISIYWNFGARPMVETKCVWHVRKTSIWCKYSKRCTCNTINYILIEIINLIVYIWLLWMKNRKT